MTYSSCKPPSAAMKAGADGYILKDTTAEMLLAGERDKEFQLVDHDAYPRLVAAIVFGRLVKPKAPVNGKIENIQSNDSSADAFITESEATAAMSSINNELKASTSLS